MSKPTIPEPSPIRWSPATSSAMASSRRTRPGRTARISPSTSISTSRAAASRRSPTATPCPRACSTTSVSAPRRSARAARRVGVRVRQPPRCLAPARHLCRARCHISILGVVRALEQNPELAKACVSRGHEIVSHGYRWIDYGAVPEEVEREHMRLADRRPDEADRRAAARLDDRTAGTQYAAADLRGRRLPLRSRLARRRAALLAAHGTGPTSSFPIPTRPTTTASTRTAASRRGRTFSPTCAMPSMCCTARA